MDIECDIVESEDEYSTFRPFFDQDDEMNPSESSVNANLNSMDENNIATESVIPNEPPGLNSADTVIQPEPSDDSYLQEFIEEGNTTGKFATRPNISSCDGNTTDTQSCEDANSNLPLLDLFRADSISSHTSSPSQYKLDGNATIDAFTSFPIDYTINPIVSSFDSPSENEVTNTTALPNTSYTDHISSLSHLDSISHYQTPPLDHFQNDKESQNYFDVNSQTGTFQNLTFPNPPNSDPQFEIFHDTSDDNARPPNYPDLNSLINPIGNTIEDNMNSPKDSDINSQSGSDENCFDGISNSPNYPEMNIKLETLENDIEDIAISPNIFDFNSQSESIENVVAENRSFHNFIDSNTQTQTLDHPIDNNDEPSISTNSNSQTLDLPIECIENSSTNNGYSQTLENIISPSHLEIMIDPPRRDCNSNQNAIDIDYDQTLPPSTVVKYCISPNRNRPVQVSAIHSMRSDSNSRAYERPEHPREEIQELCVTPPLHTPTNSTCQQAIYDNFDATLLSTLDYTLSTLAEQPNEDLPIYISSDDSEIKVVEPDLYTQIELMDTKDFDLNIAVANLDTTLPSQLDVLMNSFDAPDPTSFDEVLECIQKIKKPRKSRATPVKKRNNDPSFLPSKLSLNEAYSEDTVDDSEGEIEKVEEVRKVKEPVPVRPVKSRRYLYGAKKRRRGFFSNINAFKNCNNNKVKSLHYKTSLLNTDKHSSHKLKHKVIPSSLRAKPREYPPNYCDRSSDEEFNPKAHTYMEYVSVKRSLPLQEHFNSPYLKKIKLPEFLPEDNIEMKIVEEGVFKKKFTTYSPAQGLRLMNTNVLSEIFSKLRCPSKAGCKDGRLRLYECSIKSGLQTTFVLFCCKCGHVVTKFCSSQQLNKSIGSSIGAHVKYRERSEVNIRAMLGVYTTSLTWRGFRKFSKIMDLPNPTTVIRRSEQNRFAEIVLAEVDDSMRKWSKLIAEREDSLPSVRPNCAEIAVSFDGSWKQRGHYSNVGFAAVIERKSKKVVDYELLNRGCEACSKWTDHMIENKKAEYDQWIIAHKPHCRANFHGTSLGMEAEAAMRLWNRSEDRGLVYKVFIGDGDGSGYNSVVRSGVYNGEVEIHKEECIGHLQKRLKNHLMKATKNTKNCKYVQHALEEHKADRVGHLFAIVVGQHIGKTPEEMNKGLWRMLEHISEIHTDCPLGKDSYCVYQKALFRHQNDPTQPAPKTRKCYFSDIDLEKIKEEFKVYASVDVCSHLTLGASQNINESLHSSIWGNCLKTKYASPVCVSISVALSVLCFNEGESALAGILLALGVKPSLNSIKEFVSADIYRCRGRERGQTVKSKATRRQRRLDSKNREKERRKQDRDAARIPYQADKFGTEVGGGKTTAKKNKTLAKQQAKSKTTKTTTTTINTNTPNTIATDDVTTATAGTTTSTTPDACAGSIYSVTTSTTATDATVDATPVTTDATTADATTADAINIANNDIAVEKENTSQEVMPKESDNINVVLQKKVKSYKKKEKVKPFKKPKSLKRSRKVTNSEDSDEEQVLFEREVSERGEHDLLQKNVKSSKKKEKVKSKKKSKSLKLARKETNYEDSDGELVLSERDDSERVENDVLQMTVKSSKNKEKVKTMKKSKSHKRARKVLSYEESSEVSASDSDGEESDGVCQDCDSRKPTGLLEGEWHWIGCENCENWFHDSCIGIHLSDYEYRDFICNKCTS